MNPERFLQNNENCPEGEEPVVRYRVYTECSIPSCKSCDIYRQKEVQLISYSTLLRKTMSEKNIVLFKKMIIIAVSLLASLINFSRLTDFKEEQLYLETILSVSLYYLATSSLTGATALLLGGLFHWFLAFKTKSKNLILIVMTCLQVSNQSLRHYEWFTMIEHIFISCLAIHITVIQETIYVKIMLYCILFAYCYYMYHFGIGFEDLLLSTIIAFANHYSVTGDAKHCYLKENMSSLILWIGLKKLREATEYDGFGFQLF